MANETSMASIGQSQSDNKGDNSVDRASDHVPSQADWYWAEGVPGTGPRPEFLQANFKNLSEQARAYPELRKTLGAQKGAPEQYDFGDLSTEIDQDNPTIKEFIIYAKENRLSQDAFARTMKTYVDYEKSKLPDVNEEIAKVGPDGMDKINTIQNWVKNNLSKDSFKALEKLPVRAEVVKMLDELRQLHTKTLSRVPVTDQANIDFKPLTVAEVESEMMQNYKRYQSDPTYRAMIAAKFEQAVGSD